MIEIKDLLIGLKNIVLAEEIKKEKIVLVLKTILKTEIKTEDVQIKNGVLFLNIKPLFKNEIFLKKEKILTMLTEELGKKAPKNIR